MAIAARAVRPSVVVFGTVVGIEPRTKRGTADVFRTDVTLETPSGGLVKVEYWERDGEFTPLPDQMSKIGVMVEVSESQQYGASLAFLRYPGPDDLDLIASTLSLYATTTK